MGDRGEGEGSVSVGMCFNVYIIKTTAKGTRALWLDRASKNGAELVLCSVSIAEKEKKAGTAKRGKRETQLPPANPHISIQMRRDLRHERRKG